MDVLEATTQSFVVKLWIEASDSQGGYSALRGYITHVPSGQRIHLTRLVEILDFIAPYFEEMGLEIEVGNG
jgi:hypothetical protein